MRKNISNQLLDADWGRTNRDDSGVLPLLLRLRTCDAGRIAVKRGREMEGKGWVRAQQSIVGEIFRLLGMLHAEIKIAENSREIIILVKGFENFQLFSSHLSDLTSSALFAKYLPYS